MEFVDTTPKPDAAPHDVWVERQSRGLENLKPYQNVDQAMGKGWNGFETEIRKSNQLVVVKGERYKLIHFENWDYLVKTDEAKHDAEIMIVFDAPKDIQRKKIRELSMAGYLIKTEKGVVNLIEMVNIAPDKNLITTAFVDRGRLSKLFKKNCSRFVRSQHGTDFLDLDFEADTEKLIAENIWFQRLIVFVHEAGHSYQNGSRKGDLNIFEKNAWEYVKRFLVRFEEIGIDIIPDDWTNEQTKTLTYNFLNSLNLNE